MKEHVRSLGRKLQERVSEGGVNLSHGQRQLLCIARALLRRAAILIVDEGTSAVDPATDQIIQQTLRSSLATDTTVLVIAHRLQTIVDFDRVLVLTKGNLLEFDSPIILLANEHSVFSRMYASQK